VGAVETQRFGAERTIWVYRSKQRDGGASRSPSRARDDAYLLSGQADPSTRFVELSGPLFRRDRSCKRRVEHERDSAAGGDYVVLE
jgi:hypothetical protein